MPGILVLYMKETVGPFPRGRRMMDKVDFQLKVYTCIACCNSKHFAAWGDPSAFHSRCRFLSSWTFRLVCLLSIRWCDLSFPTGRRWSRLPSWHCRTWAAIFVILLIPFATRLCLGYLLTPMDVRLCTRRSTDGQPSSRRERSPCASTLSFHRIQVSLVLLL